MANGLGTGAEAAPAPARAPRRSGRWLPASVLEFIGCESCRMTLAEYRALDDDGKVELFDREMGRAWRVAEAARGPHEDPLARLGRFVNQVAQVRGSPIELGRAAALDLLDPERAQVRAMHPDEMIFLDPARKERIASRYAWGSARQEYPDVVVEVDNTTDVRRNKLLVYADWGFPELWVEVPNVYSPSRPRGRRPGLTIYLLESGVYRESGVSRAFPGLGAAEAHRVLNASLSSEETTALATRIGRELGRREGTGPDDDPLLRSQRTEARAEGRAEGHAEGRAEGRAEGIAEGRASANAATARTVLRGRGYQIPEDFPAGLPPADRARLAAAAPEVVVAAAVTANSPEDFLRRLRESSAGVPERPFPTP